MDILSWCLFGTVIENLGQAVTRWNVLAGEGSSGCVFESQAGQGICLRILIAEFRRHFNPHMMSHRPSRVHDEGLKKDVITESASKAFLWYFT